MIGEPTKVDIPGLPSILGNIGEESLRLLNVVGLNDASLFVLHLSNCSDSQQARARMYAALCQKKKVLIVDEFLSTLDRKTARALSFSFQKLSERKKFI